MDGLTTGRIVHYGPDCEAAIVSRVWDKDSGLVNLHVFRASNTMGTHDGDVEIVTSRLPSETPEKDRCHWIERA